MEERPDCHIRFICNYLIKEILTKLDGEGVQNFAINYAGTQRASHTLMYTIILITRKCGVAQDIHRKFTVKFMKPGTFFRSTDRECTQAINEKYFYVKLIPAYTRMLQQAGLYQVYAEDWVELFFYARYATLPGLCSRNYQSISILILENLRRSYRPYPNLYLNDDHLFAMNRFLTRFHSMTYAMRNHDHDQFCKRLLEVQTTRYHDYAHHIYASTNTYLKLFRVAFDRFFAYFDRVQSTFDMNCESVQLLVNKVRLLRQYYFNGPTALLARLRFQSTVNDGDSKFAVFVHGSFYHANARFHYKQARVDDFKVINCFELRYATPVLDLSVFMYLNISPEKREENWHQFIQWYHRLLIRYLKEILHGLKGHKALSEVMRILTIYNFNEFAEHFKRYAIFGVLFSMYLVPWWTCSEEERARLNELYETDVNGDEFTQLLMTAGGDEANAKVLDIVRHACNEGYMHDMWLNERFSAGI